MVAVHNAQEVDMDARETITHAVEELAPRLKEIALDIHAHPELGHEEVRACGLWTGFLKEHNFTVETGTAGLKTAFRAEAGSGRPAAAFMAEYDALPKLGHACGHNLSGAISCGAAVALERALESTGGRAVVFGTPAEESNGGKVPLVKSGALRDVDFAMMAHANDTAYAGGETLASVAAHVTFTGESAHAAAAPHKGINALDAVLQVFNSVNAFRQQMPSTARIHGVIPDGGAAPNIIPDFASCKFLLRDVDDEYVTDVLLPRFRAIVEGAALATGATSEISLREGYLSRFPNRVLRETYKKNARSLGVEIPDGEDIRGPRGSSDMGNVSQAVPSLHPYFRIIDEPTPPHSLEFAAASGSPFALERMVRTTTILALTAYDLLADADLLARAREAFLEDMQKKDSARERS